MRPRRAGWLCAVWWRSAVTRQRGRWQGGCARCRVDLCAEGWHCGLSGGFVCGRDVGWHFGQKGCFVRRSVDNVRRREESPPRPGRGLGAPRRRRGRGAEQGGGERRGGRREAPAHPADEGGEKKHPERKKLKACRLPNEAHKMTA